MNRELPPLPQASLPRHVAIIMDDNGRWAQRRGSPRAIGHRAGVRTVRKVLRAAGRAGIEVLTLFAFSQENWKRPELEVQLLIQLFLRTLGREVQSMHRNGVRLSFIGDRSGFPPRLQQAMAEAEALTAGNTAIRLVVAVGYGGQWDILQATQQLAAQGLPITAEAVESRLQTAGLPLPDLMIRTGGESRISNFLLWQLAYTELHFTEVLWPDFGEAEFAEALQWYAGRDRRFGGVAETP